MSVDMTKHPHWAVTVEASGEQIVRLETECYGGREISDADEIAIRTAALHLLAFIGDRTFDMIECEAFHAGYEAGERDARTPHPAPVTAREAEPVAWTGNGSLMALAEGHEGFMWPAKADAHPIPLYAHPPQPSETVAEAINAVLKWENKLVRSDDDLKERNAAFAALRSLKGADQ